MVAGRGKARVRERAERLRRPRRLHDRNLRRNCHPRRRRIHPRWSPDGSKIALIRQTGSTTALVVVDADGRNRRSLREALDAAWSPDGTRLAFSRWFDSETRELVGVVNADGTGERILARDARLPSWSPEGARLAFVSANGAEVMDADGSNRHAVSARGTEPTWAHDGSRLLLARADGLHVVSADGTGDAQVTHPEPFGLEADSGASWSPTGAQIVFERVRYNEYGVEQERRVWIASADGSGERALTAAGVFASRPAWSPGGDKIAYAAGELYAVGADGTGQTQVTTTDPAKPKSEGTIFFATSRAKRASFTVTGGVVPDRTLAVGRRAARRGRRQADRALRPSHRRRAGWSGRGRRHGGRALGRRAADRLPPR